MVIEVAPVLPPSPSPSPRIHPAGRDGTIASIRPRGFDAVSDGPGYSKDATSERTFGSEVNSALVLPLIHVVAKADESHRRKPNPDLTVTTGIDAFGVEFV